MFRVLFSSKIKYTAVICASVLLSFFSSCSSEIDFTDIPQITLREFRFEAYTTGTARDSLYIEIGFKDRDGNLGLKASEINPPFHALDTLKNNFGRYIFFDKKDDTYNRDYWLIVSGLPKSLQNPKKVSNTNVGIVVDTIKVVRNFKSHYNFFVTPYYLKDGEFIKVKDVQVQGKQAVYTDQFYARFPILNTKSDPRPLEGVLKGRFGGIYSENPVLSESILKFEVYIKDRDLNESNHVFTEPLQFVIK